MARLPKYITRYFWGDDLKSLSFAKHATYITRTLLEKGDSISLKWLFAKSDKKTIKKQIHPRMNKKSKNFWQLYLG
jgi:hypothetical protein